MGVFHPGDFSRCLVRAADGVLTVGISPDIVFNFGIVRFGWSVDGGGISPNGQSVALWRLFGRSVDGEVFH